MRIHNSPHLRLAWFCQNQRRSHRQSGQLVLDSLAYPGSTVKADVRAIYYLGAKEDIRNQYRLEACSQITQALMMDLFPYLGSEGGFSQDTYITHRPIPHRQHMFLLYEH